MATKRRHLTGEALGTWALNFARAHEAKGEGTVWPTMGRAAKRFRCKLDDVEDATQDGTWEGYIGLGVAIGIPGYGYAETNPRGEWVIEAY